MHIVVIAPPVGETVNQPGIAVVGEDDRLIDAEHRIEIPVRDSMRMLRRRLQSHEIDHVDDANLDVREVLTKQIHGSQSLESRHIASASHDRVRLTSLIGAGPRPDADSIGAVLNGCFHVQPLRRRLLSRDDDIHIVPASQAVISHRQQTVCVGRQIHADNIRLLVHDVVDEAGVLVAETIVVLPPDVRRKQIVQRRNRPPPRNAAQ